MTSVPDHLPNKILSPFFTSRAVTVPSSAFDPLPTATTLPSEGFSLAVSGMMIPPAVLVSASTLSTKTLLCNGLILLIILLYYIC